MRVADDHVLDLCRIEAELFQPAYNFFLRVVGLKRIDEDDSLAGSQRPGTVDLGADEIEIVENFGRFDVPGFACRGGAGRHIAQRIGNGTGATHRRASVPVKSNAAAFLAATRWASIASVVFCANALAPDRQENTTRAAPKPQLRFFIITPLPSFWFSASSGACFSLWRFGLGEGKTFTS